MRAGLMMALLFACRCRSFSLFRLRSVALRGQTALLLSSSSSSPSSSPANRDRNRDDGEEERVVNAFLQEHVPPHSAVLLSVSGGVDSMAMLHLLAAVAAAPPLHLRLEVVSFNHKLRPEADDEIAFVASWAARYGLPFHERVLPEDQRGAVGLQARARAWRRAECLSLLDRNVNVSGDPEGGSYYATAHHADDQVETTVLKLLRGAFISNLQPMAPVGACGRLVRPLLPLSKVQIEAYMRRRGHTWMEDASNQERKYTRNKVRLDVIPALETVTGGAPALRRRFEALAEQSAHLERWLDCEARTFLAAHPPAPPGLCGPVVVRLDVGKGSAFASLPSPLVQTEVLKRLVRRCAAPADATQEGDTEGEGDGDGGEREERDARALSYDASRALLSLAAAPLPPGAREKKMQLQRDLFAVRIGSQLLLEKKGSVAVSGGAEVSEGVEVAVEGCAGVSVRVVGGLRIAVDVTALSVAGGGTAGVHAGASPFVAAATAEAGASAVSVALRVPPGSALVIRPPSDGDRFQPPGRRVPVRLVEFLRRAGVPSHLRASVPVVAIVTAPALALANAPAPAPTPAPNPAPTPAPVPVPPTAGAVAVRHETVIAVPPFVACTHDAQHAQRASDSSGSGTLVHITISRR